MYIRGLIPWNSTELAEAVPIAKQSLHQIALQSHDMLPTQ